MMKTLFLYLCSAMLAVSTAYAAEPEALSAISDVMHRTWDKPEQRLELGPVVQEGDHAIADWSQGAKAGRALLVRSEKNWSVTLCAGDSLKKPATLVSAGIESSQASRLSAELEKAEQSLPAEMLQRMSQFDRPVIHPHTGEHHHSR